MKTDTREYDDGTEPDVYRRWCCDGHCKQGRLCPKNMPAEAATELGQEEQPNFYRMNDALEELGVLALGGVAVVMIVGLIAVVVGYFS
jgi:hypothetical protein